MDLEDSNLENCFCVRIKPRRNVVEEKKTRKRGMHRIWGEDEMERRDCPIMLIDDEEEEDEAVHDATMSGISSNEDRIFSSWSPPVAAASQ